MERATNEKTVGKESAGQDMVYKTWKSINWQSNGQELKTFNKVYAQKVRYFFATLA